MVTIDISLSRAILHRLPLGWQSPAAGQALVSSLALRLRLTATATGACAGSVPAHCAGSATGSGSSGPLRALRAWRKWLKKRVLRGEVGRHLFGEFRTRRVLLGLASFLHCALSPESAGELGFQGLSGKSASCILLFQLVVSLEAAFVVGTAVGGVLALQIRQPLDDDGPGLSYVRHALRSEVDLLVGGGLSQPAVIADSQHGAPLDLLLARLVLHDAVAPPLAHFQTGVEAPVVSYSPTFRAGHA